MAACHEPRLTILRNDESGVICLICCSHQNNWEQLNKERHFLNESSEWQIVFATFTITIDKWQIDKKLILKLKLDEGGISLHFLYFFRNCKIKWDILEYSQMTEKGPKSMILDIAGHPFIHVLFFVGDIHKPRG